MGFLREIVRDSRPRVRRDPAGTDAGAGPVPAPRPLPAPMEERSPAESQPGAVAAVEAAVGEGPIYGEALSPAIPRVVLPVPPDAQPPPPVPRLEMESAAPESAGVDGSDPFPSRKVGRQVEPGRQEAAEPEEGGSRDGPGATRVERTGVEPLANDTQVVAYPREPVPRAYGVERASRGVGELVTGEPAPPRDGRVEGEIPRIDARSALPPFLDRGVADASRESPSARPRPEPVPPRVYIGQLEVVVSAPPDPRPASRPAPKPSGLASRLYLRRL